MTTGLPRSAVMRSTLPPGPSHLPTSVTRKSLPPESGSTVRGMRTVRAPKSAGGRTGPAVTGVAAGLVADPVGRMRGGDKCEGDKHSGQQDGGGKALHESG